MLPQKLLIFIASPYLAATYHPCIPKATHPTILLIWFWSSKQRDFLMLIAPHGLNVCVCWLSSSTGLLLHGEGAETARDPARVAGSGSASLTAEGQAQQESIELVAPSEGRGKRDAKAAS